MKTRQIACSLLLAAVSGAHTPKASKARRPHPEQKDKRMEWFANAKLGIFIHWGISVNGVSESWSFYNKYLPYEQYMSQVRQASPPPTTTPKRGSTS